MAEVQILWDKDKAAENNRKHGVSFLEAFTSFHDERARVIPDPEHSGDEECLLLLGFSSEARLLVVCHTFNKKELVIRIISARRATRMERENYAKVRR